MEEDAPRSFNGGLDKYLLSKSESQSKSQPRSQSGALKRKLEVDIEADIRHKSESTSPRRTCRARASAPPRSSIRASLSFTKAVKSVESVSCRNELVSLLKDSIPPGLVLLLVGVNPGIMTGQTGYAYAHPTNHYWRLLHSSGITAFRHPPSDTQRLPGLYAVGNTNIVARPTRDASQLSKAEMNDGVPILEEKIARFRPEAVCLVGKGIWEAVWRVKHGRNIKKDEFKYGWQNESENMGIVKARGDDEASWPGARVFVATTTSALAASMSIAEKEAIWAQLGVWVKERREARGFVLPTADVALLPAVN